MATIAPLSPESSTPEVVPSPLSARDTNPLEVASRSNLHGDSRTGRRPKFTPDDDLVLVREVAAAKAHIAPNGATKERFETAAKKSNATKRLSCAVTWKSVQDRYKRIQSRFDERDKIDGLMSGVGGEVGEMEELLSAMREARQDLLNSRSASRRAAQERETEKERLGAIVRARAMTRERPANSSDFDVEGTEEETSDQGATPKKRSAKRKHSDVTPDPFDNDIAALTAALQKSYESRMAFEERRLAKDVEQGEKDREERRIEREESNKLGLEKFKLMMEAFRQR